jgi:hypothetical protein
VQKQLVTVPCVGYVAPTWGPIVAHLLAITPSPANRGARTEPVGGGEGTLQEVVSAPTSPVRPWRDRVVRHARNGNDLAGLNERRALPRSHGNTGAA